MQPPVLPEMLEPFGLSGSGPENRFWQKVRSANGKPTSARGLAI